jgi:hypothetical protein
MPNAVNCLAADIHGDVFCGGVIAGIPFDLCSKGHKAHFF